MEHHRPVCIYCNKRGEITRAGQQTFLVPPQSYILGSCFRASNPPKKHNSKFSKTTCSTSWSRKGACMASLSMWDLTRIPQLVNTSLRPMPFGNASTISFIDLSNRHPASQTKTTKHDVNKVSNYGFAFSHGCQLLPPLLFVHYSSMILAFELIIRLLSDITLMIDSLKSYIDCSINRNTLLARWQLISG